MKENSIFFPLTVVIFLAVLMAYGVSWYAKESNDLSSKITKEQLDSFTNPDVEYVEHPPLSTGENIVSPVETRQSQAARYDDIGQAIKSLNIGNIAYASPEDLRLVGTTDWSLNNTVANNLDFPQVIEVVFNNKNVLEGFFSRQDVNELLNNYLTLSDLVTNNSDEMVSLIEGDAFKGVINNQELLTKVFNSALVQEILLSKSANYFLTNPNHAKGLIENNQTLAPLLQNENLKTVLSDNPKTKNFALSVFSQETQAK
ncbi:MAG: hypothetical protein J6S61_05975 [Elusimicrobiaceae bacterium]|nr:hypothetical protein [Elusimicrobiaceae bacterium]